MTPTELQFQEWLAHRIAQAIDEAAPLLVVPPSGEREPANFVTLPPRMSAVRAALRAANDIMGEVVKWAGPLRCDKGKESQ